ncbi:hypothetical protein [Thermoproteus tenax]|uniref:hypothetical protein n=1 Tax=Thermoproteus tenax TaxID=2271 RepID=UPI00268F31C2
MSALYNSSGLTGVDLSLILLPEALLTASSTALIVAAAADMVGASPTPLVPVGCAEAWGASGKKFS